MHALPCPFPVPKVTPPPLPDALTYTPRVHAGVGRHGLCGSIRRGQTISHQPLHINCPSCLHMRCEIPPCNTTSAQAAMQLHASVAAALGMSHPGGGLEYAGQCFNFTGRIDIQDIVQLYDPKVSTNTFVQRCDSQWVLHPGGTGVRQEHVQADPNEYHGNWYVEDRKSLAVGCELDTLIKPSLDVHWFPVHRRLVMHFRPPRAPVMAVMRLDIPSLADIGQRPQLFHPANLADMGDFIQRLTLAFLYATQRVDCGGFSFGARDTLLTVLDAYPPSETSGMGFYWTQTAPTERS